MPPPPSYHVQVDGSCVCLSGVWLFLLPFPFPLFPLFPLFLLWFLCWLPACGVVLPLFSEVGAGVGGGFGVTCGIVTSVGTLGLAALCVFPGTRAGESRNF